MGARAGLEPCRDAMRGLFNEMGVELNYLYEMRACFVLCMAICLGLFMDPVSAYRHLLGVGVYDTGHLLGAGVYITAATATAVERRIGLAGVYATKCWQCTGALDSGSFVPALKR